MKLLVALALWVGALGMVLAFAQDEADAPAGFGFGRFERDRLPPPERGRGESRSCVASTRNAVSIDICVSPQVARVGEPVTVEVRSADFGRDCGEINLDFGDASTGPARTTQHRYDRPGTYVVRLVAAMCASDVRLPVTVRP